MARARGGADPWAEAPTSELQDQILPRWFVLLAVVLVPVALVVAVVALLVAGPEEVPLGARRPPPAGGLTSEVGELQEGRGPAEPVDPQGCALLRGLRVAGTPQDRRQLAEGLRSLCRADLPTRARAALQAFAEESGTVRFAAFTDSGVASTARLDREVILVNRRFRTGAPSVIAPLVAHDAAVLAGQPGEIGTALTAREVELALCRQLLGSEGQPASPRTCEDAAALLALGDPGAPLRAAGYTTDAP